MPLLGTDMSEKGASALRDGIHPHLSVTEALDDVLGSLACPASG